MQFEVGGSTDNPGMIRSADSYADAIAGIAFIIQLPPPSNGAPTISVVLWDKYNKVKLLTSRTIVHVENYKDASSSLFCEIYRSLEKCRRDRYKLTV